MLTEIIKEAEAIFLAKVDQLAILQGSTRVLEQQPVPPVSLETVKMWLSKIVHNPNGNHKKLHRYATAYHHKQQIIYNPLFVSCQSAAGQVGRMMMLDLVLHEMGHLFEYQFFRSSGHGFIWKNIGNIVGYAPVGSTGDLNRMRHRTFAAHGGTVAPHTETIGKVGASAERNHSLVSSPVKRVHIICDTHFDSKTRKEIIQMCVDQGINHHTAATQYAAWKRRYRPRFKF